MKKKFRGISKLKKTKPNIKKNDTSPKPLTRAPTGIPEFDKISRGGFIKNTTSIVCGSAGSGKTIFCTEFIKHGIDKYHENGLMISFEETRKKFFNYMMSIGIDLDKYEKEKNFIFLEYNPEQVKDFIIQGGGLIENLIEKHNIKRIVIDSLNAFVMLFKYESAQREACLELFKSLSNWECTILVTEEDKPSLTRELSTFLDFEVDGVVFLYNLRMQDERQRAIEIVKMRGSDHSKRIHPFVISNKGIKINLNRRIYRKKLR